ncbi:hypothetical protein DF3PA_10251 [Candidatus Defluviicoccus seviourii]|uniref:Uncharacterized protein n=2 Tax=root TaxID=1 RepID=A0A564W9H3_9PROT|nr:hypothetical protein DF3PB_1750004 [uncultured Defluviicoccus sp.]VUX45126.1 hypothetical protein DF3PA_10251 [Candidatus Defluviicoccus seviourii]
MTNGLPALVPTTDAPVQLTVTPRMHRLAMASLNLYRLRLAHRSA